jgi:hypothetical protein
MNEPGFLPNLVTGVNGLTIEMLAGGVEGGGVAEGNKFDHITNAAAAIEEITAIVFHDTFPIEGPFRPRNQRVGFIDFGEGGTIRTYT